MADKTLARIEVNVIRMSRLEGPQEWAKGDFSKIFSDGSEEPATFQEYANSIGLPGLDGVEIVDQP